MSAHLRIWRKANFEIQSTAMKALSLALTIHTFTVSS